MNRFDPLTIPAGNTDLLRIRLSAMARRRQDLGIGRKFAAYATVGWNLWLIELHSMGLAPARTMGTVLCEAGQQAYRRKREESKGIPLRDAVAQLSRTIAAEKRAHA